MKTRLFPLILLSVLWLFSVTDLSQAQESSAAGQPAATETPPIAEKAPTAAVKNSTTSFADSFKSGVESYKTKNYAQARDAFAKAVEAEPLNAYALTNYALSQYQLGKKGLSIALFRQALELDPELPTAKAGLKFALAHLETKDIPHQIENYETIREEFLQPVTLPMYLLLVALFLFATGWTVFNFIGKRRRAFQEEVRPPGFPVIGAILFVCLLISTSLLGLKFYDATLTRGTIVDDKVTVQAAPGENQVALFELYAGFEVLVRHVDHDWIQVTYPGASSGWIKKSALLITSGTLP